jgi:hypothetical protein
MKMTPDCGRFDGAGTRRDEPQWIQHAARLAQKRFISQTLLPFRQRDSILFSETFFQAGARGCCIAAC